MVAARDASAAACIARVRSARNFVGFFGAASAFRVAGAAGWRWDARRLPRAGRLRSAGTGQARRPGRTGLRRSGAGSDGRRFGGRSLLGVVGLGGFGVGRAVRILRLIRALAVRLVLRAPREPEAGP